MRESLVVPACLAAFVAAGGITYALSGDDQPQGITRPAQLAANSAGGPLGPAGPAACSLTFTIPGKAWGRPLTFHYSPSILRPTRLEHVCVSYPAGGGTLATVTLSKP